MSLLFWKTQFWPEELKSKSMNKHIYKPDITNALIEENRKHVINLQKSCARINQLEVENKALKAGIEKLHFESQSKLFKVQSQPH